MSNARFLGNRFEVIGGAITLALVPIGSQAAGMFVANSYAATGGVSFSDTGPVLSSHWQDISTAYDHINTPYGTAANPAYGFASEQSLGLYRSAASTMALSYGTFHLNQARLTSIRTMATSLASTSMLTDEMAFFVGGASGATLGLRVNGIVYLFNSSSTTKG